MPRRGENIRKRKDGRWEGRIIDSHTPDGKAHYKSIYAKSYNEVKELLRERTQGIQQKEIAIKNNKNMAYIAIEWLEGIQMTVKEATYTRYYILVHKHIIPHFTKITEENIENFVRFKALRGRLDGKGGLSAKTLHNLTSVLFQILKYAEKKQYIHGLHYDIVLPPQRKEPCTVLSQKEQEKLTATILEQPNLDGVGILIALYTGIRLGELCALTWGSIDFTAGVLKIRKALQRIKNLDTEAQTKTKIIVA